MNNLDFEHRCVWRHQLKYGGLRNGNGEIVRVPMESGRVGLYRATSSRYSYSSDDTGQKNWKFEFIEYEDERNEMGI